MKIKIDGIDIYDSYLSFFFFLLFEINNLTVCCYYIIKCVINQYCQYNYYIKISYVCNY